MRKILLTLSGLSLCAVVTLYAAASYPTAVKSFTTKASGETVQAAHINDLQDEVTAIETGLLGTLTHDVKVTTGKYFFSNGKATGDGIWTTPTYAGGDFTASAGTWTVDSGDRATFTYTLFGKTMCVAFIISGTDVSAAPTTLSVLIPASQTASETMRTLIQVSDAGTPGTGVARVSGSGTTIDFFKNTSATAWTATAGDNTDIFGQIMFRVN